jgi:hypothetical protein
VDERLSYLDYVKEAFHRKVRVPLLGDLPVNWMILGVAGVLGIANPGFWLLGLAAELGYLGFVGGSPRFQKLVQGERLLDAQQHYEFQVHRAVERLAPESRERYRRLLDQGSRILGISTALGEPDTLGDMHDLKARSLNQLLGIFLRLLTSRELIAENLRGLDREELLNAISSAEARLAAADPQRDEALVRSLTGTLEIQRKRLGNQDRARSSLDVIDAELLRIEQQVELIREEAAVSGKPEVLSERLEAVTTHMTETASWMEEQRDLFGSLGTETANDPLGLPRLPEIEG